MLGTAKFKLWCRLGARQSSVKDFASQMTKGLAGMEAAIAAASAEHLTHLASHREKITDHYEKEKKQLEEDSARLVLNINDYVKRMITE